MKRILTLVAIITLFSISSQAQQYRWVKGGGSSCVMSGSPNFDHVGSMCTDANRNVYAVITIGGLNISADTFSRSSVHYGGASACNGPSSIIASYNCSGQMRWAKLFDTYGTLMATDIKYDNAGSIYVVGWGTPNYTKYYTDTTVTSQNYSMFLAKYDTSGKFRWIRFLGANNFNNQFLVTQIAKVAIDPQGNPHHLAQCKSGMVLSSSVTTQAGMYDVKYSSSGSLISATRLPLDSLWQVLKAEYSPSGNLYTLMQWLNPPAVNCGFMKFSPSGSIIWSDTTGFGSGFNAFTFDGKDGIFLSGAGGSGQTTHFAGMTASNSYYPLYGFGIVAKVDTSGVGKWMVHYDCSQSLGQLNAIGLLPNGNLATAGIFAYTLRRGNDSIVTPANEGQNPYLLILDTTGSTIMLDQIHGTGFYDAAIAGTADNAGNFYLGGQFESDITATGLGTGITSTGGNTDFFIMKYGYVCNCTAPVANYTSGTASGKTIQYTYNGTTASLDSLVWNFGDGQKQKVTAGFTSPVSHAFAANGKYNVCVTAYSQCGTNSYCKQTPLAVGSVAGVGNIKVYPNPANSYFTIEEANGVTAILANSVGQEVMRFSINANKQVIDIASLPSGVYTLQLTDSKGNRQATALVKH